jgi:5-methyltetrahydropteroyltriglutamate--homocysteine methyltransferase
MANPSKYRADHGGRLARPEALVQAWADFAAGRIERAALDAVADAAIRESLAMQKAAGVDVMSDGEYRRALQGDAQAQAPEQEARFLREYASKPFKVSLHAQGEGGQALRAQVEALIAGGVRYVQIEQPGYAQYFDANARAELLKTGVDVNAHFEQRLAADVDALSGITRPEGFVVAFSFGGAAQAAVWSDVNAHTTHGALAERLFGALPVDRFGIPFEARAEAFELLRHVPEQVTVALGLVRTDDPALESLDELLDLVDAAAGIKDGDGLALTTQGGFAAQGGAVSLDAQRRKLEQIANAARSWWGIEL